MKDCVGTSGSAFRNIVDLNELIFVADQRRLASVRGDCVRVTEQNDDFGPDDRLRKMSMFQISCFDNSIHETRQNQPGAPVRFVRPVYQGCDRSRSTEEGSRRRSGCARSTVRVDNGQIHPADGRL